MMKKIMSDMKPKERKTFKASFGGIKETPKIIIEEKPKLETPLVKASVFTSGWHSNSSTNNLRESRNRINRTPVIQKKPNLFRSRIFKIFLSVFILLGVYLVLNFFEKADVKITPKHQTFSLESSEFKASKDRGSPVYFEIMIVPSEIFEEVVLTESQDVSVKAKGQAIFYNEYSTTPVNLKPGNFISDKNGKVYKTDSAITIPGYKSENGKVIAGQVVANITAFLPGESYNITSGDFTINSFKNTTKFKKIYARSKTAITGGAQGTGYTLSSEQVGSLNAIANSSFKANLLKKVNAEIPKGYILYPNAMSFSSNVDTNIISENPKTKVKISGTATALLLKEDDLRNTIVKSLIKDIGLDELKETELLNLEKLSFNFKTESQVISKDLQTVSFNLTGPLEILWHPNIDTIKLKLVGLNKNDTIQVFKSNPGIENASVTLFPPWKKYLPSDISKIHIDK